jgi:transaldolase
MSARLEALSAAGVSVWLDDLSRERIETGNLADLVASSSVVGVTTNPTIFAGALSNGERYDEQLRAEAAAAAGKDATGAIFALTTEDVRNACDILRPTYDAHPHDGRVSIEVEPGLAMDTDGTITQAHELWAAVDRANALIKIPATEPGLPAITAAIADGISVNVTLIFGIERYRAVMDAYLTGLEQAAAKGIDLSTIHSVASFFVSRVDSEVDKRLDAIGTDDALALKGKAALANAWAAYAAYQEVFGSERFAALAGANVQRPLWASTGVKDPAYPDTLYVSELVVDGTVNTMPEKTLLAFADHGIVSGDTVRGRYDEARALIGDLEAQGISYDEVVDLLEVEGVEKFDASWADLLGTVETALKG